MGDTPHNPDLYPKGVRVTPTKELVEQCSNRKGFTGTIISPYPKLQIVSVKWDGLKTSERIHVNFLDLVR